jgi:hypothetical protein
MDAAGKESTAGERPGCVLGIALGLLVLGGLITWVALPKTQKLDGTALFAAWFSTPPPEPFAVRDAARLMGGEEVVQLVNGGAGEERPRSEPQKQDPAGTRGEAEASSSGPGRVDWAKVEQGPVEQPPRTLTLVRYPEERAAAERRRLFSEKLTLGSLDEIGPEGGRMVLELGTLDLAGWTPAFVQEREFEAGGTFRDVVRVDLTRAGDVVVLNAVWSRSEPFSRSALKGLLASLRRG